MELAAFACMIGAVAMGIATIGRSPPDNPQERVVETVQDALKALDEANSELQKLNRGTPKEGLVVMSLGVQLTPDQLKKFQTCTQTNESFKKVLAGVGGAKNTEMIQLVDCLSKSLQ